MRKTALTIAIALLLAGCGLFGDNGATYPAAARDARATLLLTEPPLFLFGSQVSKARVSRDGDGTVRWLLVDRLGTGLMTLVAKTEEVDARQTRVLVSVEPPPGGLHDQVAKGIEDNPAIADFYKAAMEEQIAAKFEDREFDMGAIQGAMFAAAVSNVPNIAANMDKAAEHAEASDRANIEQAYREEAQGNWTESNRYGETEPAYGEPMDGSGSDY